MVALPAVLVPVKLRKPSKPPLMMAALPPLMTMPAPLNVKLTPVVKV